MLTPSQASASPAGWNGWYTSESHVIMRAFQPSKPRTSRMSADAATPAPQEIDPLIERCLKGDQSAWDAIVRLYWRKVFNIAYKFVGRHDEAEDLTQDVFLKLFRSLRTFDRRANFSTWLISVSRNLCIDHYRSMRREHDVVAHDVDASAVATASSTDSPLVALERRDRVSLLRAALDRLTPSLRTAVMLRDIQELSYQEIAERLGVPEGTVKSRINRGRTELARQIARLRQHQESSVKSGVSG
jgi:RNA polymerase sigma-70 factor (ECF subfamily)